MSRKTVLLICRDRAAYAAAIVERHDLLARLGRPFTPVIGPDPLAESEEMIPYEPSSGTMTSLAGLSSSELFDRSTEMDHAEPSADQPVCAYVTDDEAGRSCAATFAAFSHRRLVPLDEATQRRRGSERPRSVTVVVSSALLATKGTDWVRHRVHALFPESPFGILTAQDERELSLFVARSLRRAPQARGIAEVAWIPETKPHGIDDNGVAHVPDMRTMPARRPSPEAQVLFFRGHSREYCGQSGRLCSRPVWSEEKLACVRGHECVADVWARTPTRGIRSDIVFLDNCMGGRFAGSLEPFQNLTTQLIEAGTSAVFSSAGRYYCDELTPLLCLRLMASGWKLGDVARALNRLLTQRFGTVECVLLFGDPEAIAFSDREPLRELTPSIENARREVRFHIQEPIASDVEIFLVRTEAAALGDGPHSCRAHPPGMRALLRRLDERHAALIVLDGGGATGELVFGQTPPVDVAVLSAASRLVERITLLPTTDDENVARDVSALGERLHERTAAAAAARLGSASMDESARLSLYEETVAEASRELATRHARACRTAIEWGGFLDYFYQDRGQMDLLPETMGESTCPRCGLPLLSCHYRVFGGRTDDRTRLECERCGVLCDVPSGRHHVLIEAPAEVRLGDRFEARVSGTNDTNLPVFLGADAFVAYVDPANCEISVVSCPSRVAPSEPFTVTLDCRVDPSVRANVYDLRALLSMNGDLLLANRRIMYKR